MQASGVICEYPKNAYNQALDYEAALARAVQRLPPGTLPLAPGTTSTTGITSLTTFGRNRVPIDISTAGDNVIIAGSPGYRVRILELSLYNVVAKTITLKDSGDSLPLAGPLTNYPATSGYYLPDQGVEHFLLTPGGSFVINLSAATQVTGFVCYELETS